MFIDYELLKNKIINSKIPKPLSGTLSGHAAGEPFDKSVYISIKKQFPNETFRQYEYLNNLFSKNKQAEALEERNALFKYKTVLFLLSRGENATKQWNINNQFQEKQNDTADILISKNNKFELIDVKTRNLSKNAQPPNIISAYKLAKMCKIMLENEEFNIFDINYFQVDWELQDNYLTCINACKAELFLCNPEELYINWAAAMQIQFHVNELKQEFNGSQKEWATKYLRHFTAQAKRRSEIMVERFVIPFVGYI